jgi:hypothetical protein
LGGAGASNPEGAALICQVQVSDFAPCALVDLHHLNTGATQVVTAAVLL